MKSPGSMQHMSDDYYNQQVVDRSMQEIPRGFNKQQRARPRRMEIFLHITKTWKLIGALITDRRVPVWRKALFFGSTGGLLFILLFPDALNEAVMSTILPLAGTLLGIPLDAGFDWLAFALAVVTLLRFFPAELVAEHYRQIFG